MYTGQEGNLSGCGCDKRETENMCRLLYYLFIYLFMIYFMMLRVAQAAHSNIRIKKLLVNNELKRS
jgi:hypothetical protein